MQLPVECDDEVDLSRMFVLLSCHLSEMARSAEEVEITLTSILDDNVNISTEKMQTLQKLDFLRQALEDCSALVDVLSTNSAVSVQELSRHVKLGVTRNLFSDSMSSETVEAGDPDLF